MCSVAYSSITTIAFFIQFSFFHFSFLSLIFISNAIAMSTFDINRRVLLSFLVLFDTAAFIAKLNFIELLVKSTLDRVETVSIPAVKENVQRMEMKVLGRKSALTESQLVTSEDLELQMLGIVKARQLHEASLTVHTYAMRDVLIWEPLFCVFHNRNVHVTLVDGAHILQLVLNNSQARSQMRHQVSVPTAVGHGFSSMQCVR